MKNLINILVIVGMGGAVERIILSFSILAVCSLVVKGQERGSLKTEETCVHQGIDWSYDAYNIYGDDWHVFVALTGSVHRVGANGSWDSYGFHLGKLKEKIVDVPAGKMGLKLAYADELEIAMKGDVWQANFYKSCSQKENKRTLQIAQVVMQCLQLMDQKDCQFKTPRRRFVADGWNEDDSKLTLQASEVHARKMNVVSWEDESGQDESLVWWTLRGDEEKLRFLRIERFSGALKSQPSYSQFIEYAEELREVFIRNELSATDVNSYGGAVEVTVCSLALHIDSIQKENNKKLSSSLSPQVEYDLPKLEMDKLLEKYTPNHPLVLQHRK
jgi:hypothetical protein